MKLLLDENLSRRLLIDLEPRFPGSTHVVHLALHEASDRKIWQYAGEHGYAIVTLDSDFQELATYFGAPPKVVWLRCGNRSRRYIAELLTRQRGRMTEFERGPDSVLQIY